MPKSVNLNILGSHDTGERARAIMALLFFIFVFQYISIFMIGKNIRAASAAPVPMPMQDGSQS